MMTIRHKGAILLLAFATGSAIAQAMAPNAHADTQSYEQQIVANGVKVTPASVELGQAICARLSQAGEDGVTDVAKIMMSQGLSSHDAATFTVVAVSELCPYNHDVLAAWERDH